MTEFSSSSVDTLVMCAEFGLLLTGVVLLWRLALSPAARARRTVSPLLAWDIPLLEFGLLLWGIFVAGFGASLLGLWALKFGGFGREVQTIGAGAAFQLAMLGVCFGFRRWAPAGRGYATVIRLRGAWRDGAVTFLVVLPLVCATSWGWAALMKVVGLPVERQELVDFFSETQSPVVGMMLILLAVVVAPITEELVFRGGIFHFMRSRLPRWGALVLSACLFAALHGNLAAFAPLAVLGLVFALAYERTGNLAVPVVAHALFNLHTVVLLLLGLDQ